MQISILQSTPFFTAKCKNSGQVCNSPERIYVQSGVSDKFIKLLTDKFSSATYGDGMKNYDMGALINKKAADNVHAMVEEAIAEGAKLLLSLIHISEPTRRTPIS